jgi:hypothetical protein
LLDETTDQGELKLQVTAMKRNTIAMTNMTMTFTTDGTMALVYNEAMYSDWPSGLVHKVMKELKMKYQPQDMMTQVEL